MTDQAKPVTGGCLCGAVRYELTGETLYTGHCYCADCRKASGSGFVGFIGVARDAVRFSGARSVEFRSKSRRGGDSVRNTCPVCHSLVFGGEVDISDDFTIYAGSLDDPSAFTPAIAIFTRGKPDWAVIPPGLKVFEDMPQ
jgi:hypothetical protein